MFTARCGLVGYASLCRPLESIDRHQMACSLFQRMCAQLANNKEVEVSVYPEENIRVLNNVTFEIDLIKKNTSGKVSIRSILDSSPSTSTATSSQP